MPPRTWAWAITRRRSRLYRATGRRCDLPVQAGELHLSIAHSLKALGRQPEAIQAYRDAAAARPGYGDAYWSLANLKTYRFTPEEIASMRAAVEAPATPAVDRFHLCFALGKALEDSGEFAESFRVLRTRQRPQAVAEQLQPGAGRAQHAPAEANLHPGVLRVAARRGQRCARPHFHRRSAPLRLHAARADPGLAFAGRGHHGTRGHPAHGSGTAGAGSGRREPALPGGLEGTDTRGFSTAGRKVHRRHARVPLRQAAVSSTRCRTISAIWA